MKFEKYLSFKRENVQVVIGVMPNKIILPCTLFKNRIVETDGRLYTGTALDNIKLMDKASFIINERPYLKSEIELLKSIDNILNSIYNYVNVTWKMRNFDVTVVEYIKPEPAVLTMTREYLKIYDDHREAKVYHLTSRNDDPKVVYGLEQAREEYPKLTNLKVKLREQLLQLCDGDKDYRDYAMFYVRNIEGIKR